MRLLFRRQYTGKTIEFEDVFTDNVGRVDPFEYIVERTLLRPRDMISFVNECIKQGEGKTEITGAMIRTAEGEFSRIRRQAMEQEWKSALPSLPKLLNLITSLRVSMTVDQLMEGDAVEDLAMKIATSPKVEFDPLYPVAGDLLEGRLSRLGFAQIVIEALYRVGAIGVKLQSHERVAYSHVDQAIIPANQINGDTRIRIHPMLHRALNISPSEGRPKVQLV